MKKQKVVKEKSLRGEVNMGRLRTKAREKMKERKVRAVQETEKKEKE